jgi:hydroxymethylpyrimidine/phosphomethylpyrimidine kinase
MHACMHVHTHPLRRSTILPLASVLTPNQFEAELLTGRAITDEASALAVCDALHAMGPHTVVRSRAGAGAVAWPPACAGPVGDAIMRRRVESLTSS